MNKAHACRKIGGWNKRQRGVFMSNDQDRGTMIARTILAATASLLALSGASHARSAPDAAPAAMGTAAQLQLAQLEVEIYVDPSGRRVLVDPRTGRVVGVVGEDVQPLGRSARPPIYDEPIYDEPYYGDEPFADDYRDEWSVREERRQERRERRLRELGRAEPPSVIDRAPVIQRAPDYAVPREVPREAQPPAVVTIPPVERAPLVEPGTTNEDTASIEPTLPSAGEVETLTVPSQQPEMGSINPTPGAGPSEEVAKIQILLDRVGASPGEIDGRIGDNVNRAITAYRDLTGRALRTYDPDSIDALLAETGGDPFTTYEITAMDAAGPFVASIPEDYGEKAQMERLGYTSTLEMLAERFHMSEGYLRSLNPGVDFSRPGTRIKVANIARAKRAEVTRIVADKGNKQLRAYGANGRVVAVYPATIGSQATPSPTGTHTVERIAIDPEYTYNPNINFKQGDNDRILTIPPGPNGPVGSVWIALSKPTYGIHGTPEPGKIGKTYSNGCIRLTNWDAQELAKLVKAGVTVEFVE